MTVQQQRLTVFRTKCAEIVRNCMPMFNCFPVRECVAKRRHKFIANYITSDNILCCICHNSAERELNICYTSHDYFLKIYLHTIVKLFYYLLL